MALPLKTYDQFVQEQATIIQQKSLGILTDFSVGSLLLAITEANTASVAIFLQALSEQILALARLNTSTKADVDSFIEPFGTKRKDPTAATTLERFSRFSSTTVAIIPVGTSVSASLNNQIYAVTPDIGNSHYNSSLNAYVINIGTSYIDIPIQCTTAGTIGNIGANLITTLNTGISGVDLVTNPSAVENGQDAESDQAVYQRFPLYFASLSKATHEALEAALLDIPDVLRVNLVENRSYPDNVLTPGFFYGIVDDGTGNPPSGLLALASTVANATRGFTIAYSIFPPQILEIDIIVDVKVNAVADQSVITTNVTNSLSQYLFNLGIGGFLAYSVIYNTIYESLPTNNQEVPNITFARDLNIINVFDLTVNGAELDIQATGSQIFVLNSLTINYST